MYFPDQIDEKPWTMAFQQSLWAGLRKMAGELDPPKRRGPAMSNIAEFPTADRPITESEFDKPHSGAFRDLEEGICDCVSMAKIAAQFAQSENTTNRELVFSVCHAFEMVETFNANYYAAWYGEKGHEAPAPIGQKKEPAMAGRSFEAVEEIAGAATCHQPRRFTPAGFSLVLAALRGDQLALMVGVSSRRPSTLLTR
jgi:hypothetical protein